jgi:hypothetical protein
MHEKLERPEMLIGATYKVKTPVSDHAMYVTINDIIAERRDEVRAAVGRSKSSSIRRILTITSGLSR